MQVTRSSLLGITLAAVLAAPLTAQAAIKCWTNKDGVRECGNTIPPEYAQQETRTISNRGVTLEVKERARTPEELEQDKVQREAEEKRLAEEARKKKERAEYDMMLLSTFSSEADLNASRDRKQGALDATIEVTRLTIDGMQKKNNEYKKRAAQFERSGKPMPDDLKQDMASVEKQIEDKQKYIEAKQREKAELDAQHEADLARFRELKNMRPR